MVDRLSDEQQCTGLLRLRHLPEQCSPVMYRQAVIEDQKVDDAPLSQTIFCLGQVLGHAHIEDALGIAGLMQRDIVGRSCVNQYVEPMHEPPRVALCPYGRASHSKAPCGGWNRKLLKLLKKDLTHLLQTSRKPSALRDPERVES